MKFLIGCLGVIAVIIFLVVLPLGGWVVGSYNTMVSYKLEAEKDKSQIETQLQRRFDLVPNLVATVKGAMKHEQAVFDNIAEARTRYAGAPANTPEKEQATQQYEGALARLLVVMENYPQLKALDSVKDLMTQLEGTENRISVARQRYNETAKQYNLKIQQFPMNILAGFFGHKPLALFEGVAGSEKAPTIDFTK